MDYYAEWDDMETIAAVRDALLEKHGEVHLVLADVEAYEKLLGERTRIVSVTHVSNALGTVTPVRRIVEAAHARALKEAKAGLVTIASLYLSLTQQYKMPR